MDAQTRRQTGPMQLETGVGLQPDYICLRSPGKEGSLLRFTLVKNQIRCLDFVLLKMAGQREATPLEITICLIVYFAFQLCRLELVGV